MRQNLAFSSEKGGIKLNQRVRRNIIQKAFVQISLINSLTQTQRRVHCSNILKSVKRFKYRMIFNLTP